MGRRHGAALPRVGPEQVGSERSFPPQRHQAGVQELLQAAGGEFTENCVHTTARLFRFRRDIKVQAWYQGGISYGFHGCGQPGRDRLLRSRPDRQQDARHGRFVVGILVQRPHLLGEIARGLDIFELEPTENLSQNEIDAAKLVRFDVLNVQNQERYDWPRKLVVAKAYVDQLERSKAISSAQIGELRQAIATAETSNLDKKSKSKLKDLASSLQKTKAADEVNSGRIRALVEVLKSPQA